MSLANGHANQTAIAVLAAGESKRFNGVKQLAPVGAVAMLNKSLSAVAQCNVGSIGVVLGAHKSHIHPHLAMPTSQTASVIDNPNWQEGIASSIRAATQFFEGFDHLLIVLADQVAVEAKHLKRLLATSERHPQRIIVSHYLPTGGAPAVFPKAYYPRLMTLIGDKGARRVWNNNRFTIHVPLAQGAIDIDTRESLSKWNARPKGELQS